MSNILLFSPIELALVTSVHSALKWVRRPTGAQTARVSSIALQSVNSRTGRKSTARCAKTTRKMADIFVWSRVRERRRRRNSLVCTRYWPRDKMRVVKIFLRVEYDEKSMTFYCLCWIFFKIFQISSIIMLELSWLRPRPPSSLCPAAASCATGCTSHN